MNSGWLQLSADWREYRVDTDGRDLSRVVTPFMLIANRKQKEPRAGADHLPRRRALRDGAMSRLIVAFFVLLLKRGCWG